MRLAEFILSNTEPILQEWETFARSIWPAPDPSLALLRDHAEAILRATARDMTTRQSEIEQADKSKGDGAAGRASAKLDDASKDHALGRVRSGFHLMEVIAEYRALRASVIRLWEKSEAPTNPLALIELTRFNECIDQSLAEAVKHFSAEMDRSREIFLGILGHDLRNPLNAILLSASSLMEISTGPSADLASQIGTSGEAMGQMLADFIDFTASRLGAGIPLVIAPVDFAILCRAVAEECKAAFPGSKFLLELSGDLRGEWDGRRLRQLLSNLIGNAIQHGAKGLPIRIAARGTPGEVILQIQNGGEPIPIEILPAIFDPLSQAPGEAGQRRRHGSMGLGLYIAREVVVAHGGSITVQSSGSSGTEFTVTLPRAGNVHSNKVPAPRRDLSAR
jgi:signal transduction histidine kinase